MNAFEKLCKAALENGWLFIVNEQEAEVMKCKSSYIIGVKAAGYTLRADELRSLRMDGSFAECADFDGYKYSLRVVKLVDLSDFKF